MPIFHQPGNSLGNHTYNIYIYDNIHYEAHFHKNYEVIYVISGKAHCTVNNKSKIIEAGEFAFCLSNEVHSIRSIGGSQVWIGVFSGDFIGEFAKYQNGRSGSDFSFRCSDSIMEYLRENLIRPELNDIFMIKSCLYALCGEYIKNITMLENDAKQTTLVGNILDYIEKNYKRDISLGELAESMGYEYCYFSRIFNGIFSMSFKEYINTYRFNEACIMLFESGMSITRIAEESGFQSLRSFNEIFRRLAGMSPSEYRKGTDQISPKDRY